MTAVAFGGKYKPWKEFSYRLYYIQSELLLSALVFRELLTLQKDLESRPECRSCREGTVDINSAMGEASSDGLINVNH